mgnify:CR=1 FL=1
MTLVDTGVWFRYYHKLPLRPALVAYLEAHPPLYLSAISVWEIATKHRLGKLPCPPLSQWLDQALADYEVLPVTETIARAAGESPMANQDPADRLIIATTREYGLVLLHTDRRIRTATGFRQRYFKGLV